MSSRAPIRRDFVFVVVPRNAALHYGMTAMTAMHSRPTVTRFMALPEALRSDSRYGATRPSTLRSLAVPENPGPLIVPRKLM